MSIQIRIPVGRLLNGGETEYVALYSTAGGEGEDDLYPSPYLSSESGPKVALVMNKSGSTVLFEEEFSFELKCPIAGSLGEHTDSFLCTVTPRCPEYPFRGRGAR